ncbi:M23 family metallopeptidase [Desulfofalx alkaliphila]|uniref:M23 family metallopeptidase n=1 Tax=Desulfofalx alkaliphila TaxID=105483 RepID=UPI00068B351E|nr:M23 family metallopeptidase [Desulfofalx alkaliphila]
MLKEKLKNIYLKLTNSFTIMYVPHSKESTYSRRIPYLLPVISLLFMAGMVIALVGFYFQYTAMKANMAELKTLQAEDTTRQKQLDELKAQAQELEQKMLEIRLLEKDVREILDRGEAVSRSGLNVSRDIAQLNPEDRSDNTNNGDDKGVLSFLAFKSSPKAEDWHTSYTRVKGSTEQLLAQTDEINQILVSLKEDVSERNAYYAAKPQGLPAEGSISSGYGYRKSPFNGRSVFHPGIDIAASHGTPVVATGQGVVTFAEYRSGYGRTVIIDHPYGFRTLYAHNSRLNVSVGDHVARGDVIAYVGSTGASTGPHLHYEVHLNGQHVDPADYIR